MGRRSRAGIPVKAMVCAVILGIAAMGTGCGRPVQEQTEAGSASRYPEHMELTVAYWQIDDFLARGEEDAVLKTLEDKFNITIVPQNITWDDYYGKIRLWAETGELPDLFVGAGRQGRDYYQWVREGILHEIPQDLSAYPHLEQYMDSPEKEGCMVDGKLYCIFRQTYSEQAETIKDRTIAYRWDLAREAGITREPENREEFRAMIQAIRQADSRGTGDRKSVV